VGDDVLALTVKEGYEPKFGARPLRRAVQRFIENPLSNNIIEGKFKAGDEITGVVKDGKIEFEKTGKANFKPKPKDTSTFVPERYEEAKPESTSGSQMEKKGRRKTK
jgi:hypothetical protein